MSSPIQLESISKCYRIFENPRQRFRQAALDCFQNLLSTKNTSPLYREYWALRDISFELHSGEAVGILGRNGAGKSTLLQIIAGTLEPTCGTVKTSGRISALLELGSGFNPQFTGHENVLLNAQILGVSLEDALARFDEIASFADIGDFINQPVKTYSSGMMMRLAFAVQVLLDPDILIVDEALSVGDVRFQEKCFRMLRRLRDEGTTILFVSHDINSVTSFCDRALLFDNGRLISSGSPGNVSKIYIKSLYSEQNIAMNFLPIVDRKNNTHFTEMAEIDEYQIEGSCQFGNNKVSILEVKILDKFGKYTEVLVSGESCQIVQLVIANADIKGLSSGFVIRDKRGVDIFGCTNKTANVLIPHLLAGDAFQLSVKIDTWLAAGDYFLQAANAGEDGIQYDCQIDAVHFKVVNTPLIFESSIVNLNPKVEVNLLKNSRLDARNE